MAVNKVSVDNIPKDVLGDLQALVSTSKEEYVVIGSNFYTLEPMPAIKLMDVLGKFMETLEGIRRNVIEEVISTMTPEKQADFDSTLVFVTVRDILKDKDAILTLKDLMSSIVEGVDSDDFEAVTPTQLSKLIDAIVKVNIDTLPQSFREAILPGSTTVTQEAPIDPDTGDTNVKNP